MSKNSFFSPARSWLPMLLVGALVGALVGVVVSFVRPERYTSTMTGLVVAANVKDMSDASAGQSVALAESQIYAALGSSSAVAQGASAAVGGSADDLKNNVSVVSGAVVPTVTISAQASSASDAQRLARAWFSSLASQGAKAQVAQGSNAVTKLVQVGDATMPTSADQPTRPVLIGLLALVGAVAGLLVGAALGGRRRRSVATERAHDNVLVDSELS